MKTVIYVFKQHIKITNCDDAYNHGYMLGLGDCLRGVLTLYRLSTIYKFNLIIDIRHHPISNFLEITKHDYENIIDTNIEDLKFFSFLQNLQNYLENTFKNEDIIYLNTNAIYYCDEIVNTDNILTSDEKQFMKNILKPNENFNNYIENKLINLPKKFNIIHFRLGDEVLLYNNLSQEQLENYENIFKKYYEENDVLISDSAVFKNYIKSKYNVIVSEINIGHFGHTNNLEEIHGTLFDFFLQSKSKKIKTYTNYYWISGFIKWNSNIFDIPVISIK